MLWKKIKKIIWSLAFTIALGVFLYAAYQLISQYLVYREAEQEHENIVAIARSEEKHADQEGSSPINFDPLVEINSNVIGWIVVEETVIDYPIVQSEDNETYLTRTFSGTSNASGAIFIDMNNAPDFSDSQTIIYGHNMNNGSMFAALAKFLEQSFFEMVPTFTIYTPEGEKHYEIFSAYVTSAYSDTYLNAFSTGENFATYLQYITGLSQISTGINPVSTDKIVSLSTCENTTDDARIIVHGRLMKES